MVTRKPGNRGLTHLTEGFSDALGHTIKVARTDLGIERKDLAEQAGISYSYLAAIEKGHRQSSSQVLIALAEALGVRTHQLVESAEGRRDRNLNATEELPQWLTGQDQGQGISLAAAAPSEARAMIASPVPPAAGRSGEQDNFAARMENLKPRLSESDRRLLLEMANKLADQQDE